MSLSVMRAEHGFAVFEDGKRVSMPFPSASAAEHRMRDILRMRQRRERPCITCGTPFMSEGAHHRMCNSCRARGEDTELYGFNVPRKRR